MCCASTRESCNKLQPTQKHCNTLQHTATPCNTRYATAHRAHRQVQRGHRCVVQQRGSHGFCRPTHGWWLWYSGLVTPRTHSATHCNTLQQTASHYNKIRNNAGVMASTDESTCDVAIVFFLWPPTHTLQHTATLCNTLQQTATHCNTLQHTLQHVAVVLQVVCRLPTLLCVGND